MCARSALDCTCACVATQVKELSKSERRRAAHALDAWMPVEVVDVGEMKAALRCSDWIRAVEQAADATIAGEAKASEAEKHDDGRRVALRRGEEAPDRANVGVLEASAEWASTLKEHRQADPSHNPRRSLWRQHGVSLLSKAERAAVEKERLHLRLRTRGTCVKLPGHKSRLSALDVLSAHRVGADGMPLHHHALPREISRVHLPAISPRLRRRLSLDISSSGGGDGSGLAAAEAAAQEEQMQMRMRAYARYAEVQRTSTSLVKTPGLFPVAETHAATLPAAKGRAPEARDTSVVRASQSLPQLPVLRAALQSLAIDLEAGGVEVSE